MLTNEQRAHDIAIQMLNFKLSPQSLEAIVADNRANGVTDEPIKINPGEIYMDVYTKMLDFFEKQFPQNP